MTSEKINIELFGRFGTLFEKLEKKIDFKFEIFRNFTLGIGFFTDFAKRTSNFPSNLKFIYPELHLSQFLAKSENVFC